MCTRIAFSAASASSLADGFEDGLVLLLKAVMMVRRRERNEPEPQRPLVQLAQHFRQLEVLAGVAPAADGIRDRASSSHGCRVRSIAIPGLIEDLRQCFDVADRRHARRQAARNAISLIIRTSIICMTSCRMIGFTMTPLRGMTSHHLLEHEPIERLMDRRPAKPEKRRHRRLVDAFARLEFAGDDAILDRLVGLVTQRLPRQRAGESVLPADPRCRRVRIFLL